MATIGNLVVNLGLNTAPFQKGAAVARGMAGKLGSGLMAVSKGAAIAGASLAAAGAAAGAATLTAMNSFRESAAMLGKLSRQTGASVTNLSELQHVANRTGVDFDDVAGSIEELNIRLGETIREGSGPAGAALQALGLDANKLANIPVDDRLRTIGEALNGVQNQAERGFLADEIFGGDAFKILPILRMSREEFAAMQDEAHALGVAITDGDVAAAKTFNSALQQVQTVFTALGKNAVVAFAPFISQVMPTVVAGMKTFLSVTKTVFSGVVDGVLLAQFAFQNWQQVGALAVTAVNLAVVQMAGTITHFFTGTLPALFSWFTSNWKNIFFTAFDIATTVFINLGKSIRQLFANLMDILSGELSFSDLFKGVETNITKGFANSISKLPDIPPRVVGELEQRLSSDFSSLQQQVAGDAQKFINDKRESLFGGAAGSMPDFSGADTPGGSNGGKGDLSGAGAISRGTADAFSAIQKAVRGGRDAEQKKIAQSTKMTAQASREAADSLKVVADNTAGLSGLATEGF